MWGGVVINYYPFPWIGNKDVSTKTHEALQLVCFLLGEFVFSPTLWRFLWFIIWRAGMTNSECVNVCVSKLRVGLKQPLASYSKGYDMFSNYCFFFRELWSFSTGYNLSKYYFWQFIYIYIYIFNMFFSWGYDWKSKGTTTWGMFVKAHGFWWLPCWVRGTVATSDVAWKSSLARQTSSWGLREIDCWNILHLP